MSDSCRKAAAKDMQERQDFAIDEQVENDDREDDNNDDDDMDVTLNGADFWVLQHPMEPPDEDMPVKCPMPNSSFVNNEGEIHAEEREALRKRREFGNTMSNNNRRKSTGDADEPTISPIRQMRKRDHGMLSSSSSGHYTMTPLMRIPPHLSTLPADRKNVATIFQMLQQSDR